MTEFNDTPVILINDLSIRRQIESVNDNGKCISLVILLKFLIKIIIYAVMMYILIIQNN